MGPPPRRSNQSAPRATDTANDTDNVPTWNTALPRLPQFLAALQRNDYLFSQTKSALSLYTRGYILDQKGCKAVQSWRHIEQIINNPTQRYDFKDPSLCNQFKAHAHTTVLENAAKIRLGATYEAGDDDAAEAAKDDNAKSKEKELLSYIRRECVQWI